MNTPFENEMRRLREARLERLRAPYGWLSLCERYVLEPGETRLPNGVATRQGQTVRLQIDGVAEHTWPPDAPSTAFLVGRRRYELLRRGNVVAIRVRDPDSEARRGFAGIDFYPPDERYRVEARLDAAVPPRNIDLAYDLGAAVPHECPGTLTFTLGGAALRLDPVIDPDDPSKLFILFGDLTNRDETYGAGRFLYTAPADRDGRVLLDFNQAFNPPCALTAFASCPLAPPQNRLVVRIEAGEKSVETSPRAAAGPAPGRPPQ